MGDVGVGDDGVADCGDDQVTVVWCAGFAGREEGAGVLRDGVRLGAAVWVTGDDEEAVVDVAPVFHWNSVSSGSVCPEPAEAPMPYAANTASTTAPSAHQTRNARRRAARADRPSRRDGAIGGGAGTGRSAGGDGAGGGDAVSGIQLAAVGKAGSGRCNNAAQSGYGQNLRSVPTKGLPHLGQVAVWGVMVTTFRGRDGHGPRGGDRGGNPHAVSMHPRESLAFTENGQRYQYRIDSRPCLQWLWRWPNGLPGEL